MDANRGMPTRLDDAAVPARIRVRAAVLAAVGAPGGCPRRTLGRRVAAGLGRPLTPELERRVDGALGLLIVRGAVDEFEGLLFLACGVRAAV